MKYRVLEDELWFPLKYRGFCGSGVLTKVSRSLKFKPKKSWLMLIAFSDATYSNEQYKVMSWGFLHEYRSDKLIPKSVSWKCSAQVSKRLHKLEWNNQKTKFATTYYVFLKAFIIMSWLFFYNSRTDTTKNRKQKDLLNTHILFCIYVCVLIYFCGLQFQSHTIYVKKTWNKSAVDFFQSCFLKQSFV